MYPLKVVELPLAPFGCRSWCVAAHIQQMRFFVFLVRCEDARVGPRDVVCPRLVVRATYIFSYNHRFAGAHGASKICCMCFDASGRRLLTGANDGTVKMWNFSNGKVYGLCTMLPSNPRHHLLSIVAQKPILQATNEILALRSMALVSIKLFNMNAPTTTE